MQARGISYWISTVLISLSMFSGGVAYIAGAEWAVKGVGELGYPAYVVTLLGIWKVLAVAALLAPGLPRVKEWAYAGIAFDLTGAAFSHAAIGHPVVKVLVPLLILGVAMTSYLLRPASRRLADQAARSASPASRRSSAV